MADLLGDYYKQLQTLNQQRGMTGNQALNKGMDASLAEGYLDSQNTNRYKQEQLDLQKGDQALKRESLDTAKSGATTALVGQAIGGAANLGTQLYGINKRWGDKTPSPEVATGGEIAGQTADYSGMGSLDYSPAIEDVATADYTGMGSLDYSAGGTDWTNFDWGSSGEGGGVFDWIGGLF